MPTLKELFTKEKGGPITVDGRQLFSTYVVQVKDGEILKLDFLRSAARPVQGISLTAKRCQLEVSGSAGGGIELWTNSAPKHVELKVVRAKSGATVDIVNQWIDEKYGTSRQVNNAAIEIEKQADDTLLLRCSDGVGETDFDDLVFQLVVSR
jgi:hypothetical protein